MKEIIIYYSLGGTCKSYATKRAEESGADLQEVLERKKRGKIGAFCPGAIQAIKQKSSPIIPIEKSLDEYEKIILVTPIWAGGNAPAINSAAALIPKGKTVEIVAISGAGKDYGEKLADKVRSAGCEVSEIVNIKSSTIK